MKELLYLKSKIASSYSGGKEKIEHALRKKAIEKAKVKIALSGKTIEDLSEDELEIIVIDEMGIIKSRYSGFLSMALLAYIGIE